MGDPWNDMRKITIPEQDRIRMAFDIYKENYEKLLIKGYPRKEMVDHAFAMTDDFILHYVEDHSR